MESKKLRDLYAEKLNEAKRLAAEWKGKEAEMPKDVSERIDALLGESDQIKVKLDMALRLESGDHYLNDPAGTKAAHHGWRPAGPNEGEPEVDAKSWRQVEVDTPFGRKSIRYYIPLVVQKKGYGSAFEAYVRRGMSELGPNDRKTLTEGVDTAGGFLSPEDYHTELIKKVATIAAIRVNARAAQTSRDVGSWPRIKYTTDDKYTSGVRLAWTGESPASATTHRVTDPVFGVIKVPVHTAMASMPISNDLIEDSVFDVLGISSDLLAEAFALGEDDTFINGTGVNQPMGIKTQADSDGPASVASGSGSTLTADGLIDLYFGVPAQYRRNAKWVLNSATQKVIEKLKDGQNRYLVSSLINGSLATPAFDTIKGKPIVIDEFMPDIAANAFPVLFGDLNGYLVLDRVGFSVQRLSELYAETNITLLLARKRVGGYPVEPYRMKLQKVST